MEKLTGYLRRTAGRIASMSAGGRCVAAALAALAVAGAVWLALAAAAPDAVPVTDELLAAGRLGELRADLNRRGISCGISDGRLCVGPESLDAARAVLAAGRSPTAEALDDLRTLAESSDIWSSQAQTDRRWHVAKMAVLSGQISSLAGVDSATVILSDGSRGRFGRPGRPGGASVKLTMRPGRSADDDLCETIADMVAASVADLDRQAVCIVDGKGRSYRPAPAPPADGPAMRIRQAEVYHAARVRKALAYIDGVVVTVRAVPPDTRADHVGRCVGAAVSIPRSYLVSTHRAHGAGQRLEAFASARQSEIKQVVMHETQLADPGAVSVTWHHDVSHVGPEGAIATRPPSRQAGRGSWIALARWAAGAGAVVMVGWLVWRRLASASRPDAGETQTDQAANSTANAREAGQSSPGPFAFLADTPAEQLQSLLADEHPQTIALVLAHLGPGKAAAVLAHLEPDRQVDVVRRIASLEAPPGQVAGEIARGLAARMGMKNAPGAAAGGVSAAAQILHHVGYEGEQAVLDGLQDDEPALAETIRRRLFEFEDIAALSPETLGRALADLPSDDIAVALRTAGDEIRTKVLAGLAGEAAGQVRQAMDRIGPVRLSDVEAAQQRLAVAVRRADSGHYVRDRAGRPGQKVQADSEQ